VVFFPIVLYDCLTLFYRIVIACNVLILNLEIFMSSLLVIIIFSWFFRISYLEKHYQLQKLHFCIFPSNINAFYLLTWLNSIACSYQHRWETLVTDFKGKISKNLLLLFALDFLETNSLLS
jgi:hypothetical protein